MSAYTVDPDALRAAARAVDQLADSVVSPAVGVSADPGHAGLASAMSEFDQQVSSSWNALRQTTVAVARGLEQTAEVFEGAMKTLRVLHVG